MTQEPTVVHRNSVTRRGYYRLEDIPDGQGGGWYWDYMLTLGKIELLEKED